MTRRRSSNVAVVSTPSRSPQSSRRSQAVSAGLAAHLEHLIAVGEFAPGSKLPAERVLAESLAVSRASLREALQHLETKNLIERMHGRGTIVLAPPARVTELYNEFTGIEQELADVAELRSVVEPKIAELAATRASPSDLRQMEDILRDSGGELAAADSLRLDMDFHLALARASQNPLLGTLSTLVSSWTAEVRQHSHSTREGRRVSVEGHRAIHLAILAKDSATAARAMTSHLDEVAALIRKSSERQNRTRTRRQGAAG